MRHFGAGGIAEAETFCEEASRDLLAFVRPPDDLTAKRLEVNPIGPGVTGRRTVEIRFDSPRPSGIPANDRVIARLIPARHPRNDRRALVFHHALFQKYWGLWEWFLTPFTQQFHVVMMAAPYHFERRPPGQFAGEGTVNPNPWRLYDSIRQWAWDQKALMNSLPDATGLDPVAVVGFSLGAFQSLLVASAGGLANLPLVSVAATNRYAFGLRHGVLGKGTMNGLRRAGIDGAQLDRMVDAIQLERYVPRLRGRPVLYIAGRHDRVDPPPSSERLEAALGPTRSVWLNSGHGTVLLERARIAKEVFRFLAEAGIE